MCNFGWKPLVLHTSRLAWRSLSFSARTLCCSALSALRFSCLKTENIHMFIYNFLKKIKLCQRFLDRFTHNSRFEGNEFLLLLFPVLEVSIDEALQLKCILVLTFLLNVLRSDTQETMWLSH